MLVWGCKKIHKTWIQLEFDGLNETSFNFKGIPKWTAKKKKVYSVKEHHQYRNQLSFKITSFDF